MAPSKKKSKEKRKSGGSCFTCLIKFAGYFAAFLALVFYSPILNKLGTVSDRRSLPDSFTGPFRENEILSRAAHLFQDQLHGPESVSFYKGDLYTGTQGGDIWRIKGGKTIEVFTNIGNDSCKNPWETRKCGRVLGNRVDSKGNLYFIDAYFGLKKVPLTGTKPKPTTLLPADQQINGSPSRFLDDLVLNEGAGKSNGTVIYMTDASKVWDLEEVMILFVDREESGRIIAYDETTKEATVLVDNLSFPNGIEISDDKNSLIISELNKRRILRHFLKGPKKGQTEVLIDNLPGEPDNIRRSASKDETYWVALAIARNAQTKSPLDYLDDHPIVRNLFVRLFYAAGRLIELVGQAVDFPQVIHLGHRTKYMHILFNNALTSLIKSRGMVLEIDSNGKVITCLHSPDGKTNVLSEVREVREKNQRVLYLGSVSNNFLGRLELN